MKKRLLIGLILVMLLVPVSCGAPPPAPVSEPPIPAHFTTYTDEAGFFSISYPPDWELPPVSAIELLEEAIKEVITSIESDAPVEKVNTIFFAGLPTEAGYMPSVNIVVESFPGIVWTHNNMVEVEIRGIKNFVEDYHELWRVKTTVGGREATIVECEGTYLKLGKYHWLVMLTLVDKTAWTVTCTASPEKFSDFEDDLHAIVRSLRILK